RAGPRWCPPLPHPSPHRVSRAFIRHEGGRWHFHARRTDASDTLGDIAHPPAAGDVIIEPRVAVDEDVDARAMLGRDMTGEAIEMLFAIGKTRKSVRKRNAAEVLGVPVWTGQCPSGGCEKSPVFCSRKHASNSRFHQ